MSFFIFTELSSKIHLHLFKYFNIDKKNIASISNINYILFIINYRITSNHSIIINKKGNNMSDFRKQIHEDIKEYQTKFPNIKNIEKDEWVFNYWI